MGRKHAPNGRDQTLEFDRFGVERVALRSDGLLPPEQVMSERLKLNKRSLRERLENGGPKKLLGLDGGGIRGVLSLEILRKLENPLRVASGRNDYRLADLF